MTTTMNKETTVPINSDADIVVARQKARELAVHLGFSPTDSTLIATAISELARNIVTYAKKGVIRLKVLNGESADFVAVRPLASGKVIAIGNLGVNASDYRGIVRQTVLPSSGTESTLMDPP